MIDWFASWRRVKLDGDPDNARELKPSEHAVVAIDPGAHGAAIFRRHIASGGGEHLVVALGGERVGDSLALFTASMQPTVIVIESQYVSRGPSMLGPEIALRAGIVLGVIAAQCNAAGIKPHVLHVAPQTWQGAIGVPHHADRKTRKRIAAEHAADFVEQLGQHDGSKETVRLAINREGVADAFGILEWWLSGPRLRVKRSA